MIPVTILIPTHDRAALIERTLQSVIDCAKPENSRIRVVVIENGGKFGTQGIINRLEASIDIDYVFFEEGNKSAALNSILHALADDLVIFLDDDVIVHELLLLRYVVTAQSLGRGYFFGGEVFPDFEEAPPEWLTRFLPRSVTGWHPEVHSPPGKMYFLGANWAAFGSDLLHVGGFDQKLGPGGTLGGTGQEINMQARLVRAGVKPHFVSDAHVWHYVPKSRSTPKWALQRAHKMAITAGFRLPENQLRPCIFGIPLWLVRLLLRNALALMLANIRRNPVKQFEAKFRLNENMGSIQGIRKRRRMPEVKGG